jgi:hypothetical protein
MVSGVGSSKAKRKTFEDEVGENTRNFQDANIFLNINRSKMR